MVSEAKWLDDEAFLDALEISETLPGLNAVNMRVIIGDNLRGIPGRTRGGGRACCSPA